MTKSWLWITLFIAACGGPSSTAPSESSGPRPVRVDAPEDDTAGGPRPIRVAPTVAGEAAESDDLADPPPVEAPTAH